VSEEKFDFENILVYQRSLDYVAFIYNIVSKFPKAETFSLSDQFKRASVSVSLNIAEGSGGSKPDFKRFLTIARRSVRERLAITEISIRQHFIDNEAKRQSRAFCRELSKMISGLIKSLK
jgi:four helix bundle protein